MDLLLGAVIKAHATEDCSEDLHYHVDQGCAVRSTSNGGFALDVSTLAIFSYLGLAIVLVLVALLCAGLSARLTSHSTRCLNP